MLNLSQSYSNVLTEKIVGADVSYSLTDLTDIWEIQYAFKSRYLLSLRFGKNSSQSENAAVVSWFRPVAMKPRVTAAPAIDGTSENFR
jgi:hypothetical protein